MGKWWIGVALVFLLILSIRLYAAFQTPYFSSDTSYLHLRAIENIREGKLLWHDELGYSGRTIVMSPLFDAILAMFSLLMPLPLALKIIPNIFATLLVIPAYLIAYKLTQKYWIALFTALFTSAVPEFFSKTFNQITPLTLAIPIFFFLAYAWLQVPQRKWIIIFLITLLIFSFLHPLSIIFVLSLSVYIALTTLEKQKPTTAEYELGLFSIFFTLWAQFILYKKPILFHGAAVIWQNIPQEILSTFYTNITIWGAIWSIGLAPLTGGTYALYKTAFKKPTREIQLLFSICIVSIIMFWFKLINSTIGFTLLGITLTLLFAQRTELITKFFQETKISKFAGILTAVILFSALTTVAYPALADTKAEIKQTITEEEYETLASLNNEIPVNATIIAPPHYGNYITQIAKRKNVIDEHFLLIPQINERYEDVARLYKTAFETEAVELFDKYSATYIIVPPEMDDIKFSDSKCFKRIRSTNIQVYEKDLACEVKVVS